MTMRPEPYRHLDHERVYSGLDALGRAAAARGVSTGGLALAWALGGADSVVVGPRRPSHLNCVREAISLELSAQERDGVGSLLQEPQGQD
jgi:aryl-alcohol dehydrogenase-like predicted oxidoreductase